MGVEKIIIDEFFSPSKTRNISNLKECVAKLKDFKVKRPLEKGQIDHILEIINKSHISQSNIGDFLEVINNLCNIGYQREDILQLNINRLSLIFNNSLHSSLNLKLDNKNFVKFLKICARVGYNQNELETNLSKILHRININRSALSLAQKVDLIFGIAKLYGDQIDSPNLDIIRNLQYVVADNLNNLNINQIAAFVHSCLQIEDTQIIEQFKNQLNEVFSNLDNLDELSPVSAASLFDSQMLYEVFHPLHERLFSNASLLNISRKYNSNIENKPSELEKKFKKIVSNFHSVRTVESEYFLYEIKIKDENSTEIIVKLRPIDFLVTREVEGSSFIYGCEVEGLHHFYELKSDKEDAMLHENNDTRRRNKINIYLLEKVREEILGELFYAKLPYYEINENLLNHIEDNKIIIQNTDRSNFVELDVKDDSTILEVETIVPELVTNNELKLEEQELEEKEEIKSENKKKNKKNKKKNKKKSDNSQSEFLIELQKEIPDLNKIEELISIKNINLNEEFLVGKTPLSYLLERENEYGIFPLNLVPILITLVNSGAIIGDYKDAKIISRLEEILFNCLESYRAEEYFNISLIRLLSDRITNKNLLFKKIIKQESIQIFEEAIQYIRIDSPDIDNTRVGSKKVKVKKSNNLDYFILLQDIFDELMILEARYRKDSYEMFYEEPKILAMLNIVRKEVGDEIIQSNFRRYMNKSLANKSFTGKAEALEHICSIVSFLNIDDLTFEVIQEFVKNNHVCVEGLQTKVHRINLKTLEVLLKSLDIKESLNQKNIYLAYLVRASLFGDVEVVQKILDNCEELLNEKIDMDDRSANRIMKVDVMQVAAYGNQVEIIKILREKKPQSLFLLDQYNPLCMAVINENLEAVEELLQFESIAIENIKINDNFFSNILAIAVEKSGPEVVEIILRHKGAELLNKVDKKYGYTPLHFMAISNCVKNAEKLLDHPDINVDIKDLENNSIFIVAAIHGSVEFMELLLERGDKNKLLSQTEGKYGYNLWHIAASLNHVGVSDILFNNNKIQDANLRDKDGKTPLISAVEQCSYDFIKNFIYKVDKAELLNSVHIASGYSALHIAAIKNDVKSADFLLMSSLIDCNIKDRSGQTPFIIAMKNNNFEFIKSLLEKRGADIVKEFINDSSRDLSNYKQILFDNSVSIQTAKQDITVRISDSLGREIIKKEISDYFPKTHTIPKSVGSAFLAGRDSQSSASY